MIYNNAKKENTFDSYESILKYKLNESHYSLVKYKTDSIIMKTKCKIDIRGIRKEIKNELIDNILYLKKLIKNKNAEIIEHIQYLKKNDERIKSNNGFGTMFDYIESRKHPNKSFDILNNKLLRLPFLIQFEFLKTDPKIIVSFNNADELVRSFFKIEKGRDNYFLNLSYVKTLKDDIFDFYYIKINEGKYYSTLAKTPIVFNFIRKSFDTITVIVYPYTSSKYDYNLNRTIKSIINKVSNEIFITFNNSTPISIEFKGNTSPLFSLTKSVDIYGNIIPNNIDMIDKFYKNYILK